MIVSPAATGSVQSDTPPVSALAAVLRQGVEILVVVHPTHSITAFFNGEGEKREKNRGKFPLH